MSADAATNAKRVALKIDVDTYRGTLQGVPRLIESLRRHGAGATFLFSLGPDHSGRALNGMLGGRRAGRVSLLEHYGPKTLLYGTLLPAPDIGKRCADVMRMAHDTGFETGIHAWDRVKWQTAAATADADWTLTQMRLAQERFQDVFGVAARVHGAASWHMNKHGYRLTQRLGFDYCSDTRGTSPFIPVIDAELIACPQIPTTLATCDELIGLDGTDAGNVARRVIELAERAPAPAGHVFTLRAELEGMKLLPQFEELLHHWRANGVEMLSLGAYLEAAGGSDLPRHRVEIGTVPGRSGTLAVQGAEFLA